MVAGRRQWAFGRTTAAAERRARAAPDPGRQRRCRPSEHGGVWWQHGTTGRFGGWSAAQGAETLPGVERGNRTPRVCLGNGRRRLATGRVPGDGGQSTRFEAGRTGSSSTAERRETAAQGGRVAAGKVLRSDDRRAARSHESPVESVEEPGDRRGPRKSRAPRECPEVGRGEPDIGAAWTARARRPGGIEPCLRMDQVHALRR